MREIYALLGMVTACTTHHFARNGDIAMTIFGCFGMYILWDALKKDGERKVNEEQIGG